MTRSYACQRLLRSTTASICRGPSAFVCPSAAVPTSAPDKALDDIRSSRSVSGAAVCLVASSICIEVECPNRVVQCSGLRLGSLRLAASSQPTMPSADFCMRIPKPRGVGSTLAHMQISPGIAHLPSRLCLSDIRRSLPYKFRALQILACSPRRAASYPLPVRQASALPSASFRFAVARDTLAIG